MVRRLRLVRRRSGGDEGTRRSIPTLRAYPSVKPSRSRHRVWTVLVPQWATTVLAAALVWSFDESRASVLAYLSAQLLPAVGSRRELTPDSFLIAKMLLQGVWLPMSIFAAILLAAARVCAGTANPVGSGPLFLMLGLAGTLPILISTKQMGHYLVPAVPLHALAASVSGLSNGGADRRKIQSHSPARPQHRWPRNCGWNDRRLVRPGSNEMESASPISARWLHRFLAPRWSGSAKVRVTTGAFMRGSSASFSSASIPPTGADANGF